MRNLTLMDILHSSDEDIELSILTLKTEQKRRLHKGVKLVSFDEITAHKSIWQENGSYSRGYSSGFILNQDYSRIASLLQNGKLFSYLKKQVNARK